MVSTFCGGTAITATTPTEAGTSPQAGVRLALNTIFRDTLRPLTGWLGVLYLLFAAGHQLQPPKVVLPMTVLALGSSAAMFAAYLFIRRRPLPVRWAHPAAAGLGVLVLVNSLAHLYLTDNPIHTTNLIFFIMGAALLFLSTPWFAVIVAESLLGWGVIARLATPNPDWRHFGFALVIATILAVVLHKVRIDTYTRIELARIRDQEHQVQLEQALHLARAEVAAREEAERRALRLNEELERRVNERTLELRQANQAMQSQIESSPMGIAVLDTQGRVRVWNAAAVRIFGWTAEEVLGQPYPTVPGPRADELKVLFQRVLKGETIRGLEVNWRRKDRSSADVRLYTSLLRNPDGVATGVIALMEDITQTKRLEEQLRQSQKMEAIGKLAGGIAHDFNNLLTAIIGFNDLILDKTGESGPVPEAAMQIRKAAERAASLTSQLLSFSRRQMLQPRVLDLNVVVGDMQKLLRRVIGEHIELITTLDAAQSRTKIDPGHLEQVILNLVVNAVDAMPRGGRLTIRTFNADMYDESLFSGSGTLLRLCVGLSVNDTGIGMDAATQARIFEPFFTTKEQGKGTGLGLSMVYGIVRQSGGSITCSSRQGVGSTFSIFLPLAEAEDAAHEQPAALATRSSHGTETVLLVEDEELVRMLALTVLTVQGYTVLEASTGAQAIAMARDCPSAIDLVITDVVMPEVNGVEVVQRVAPLHPEARVLYISGYTDNDLSELGLERNSVSLLPKPFTPRSLLKAVREVLDSTRA